MEQLTTAQDIEVIIKKLPVASLMMIYKDISQYYNVFEQGTPEFTAVDNISTDLLNIIQQKIDDVIINNSVFSDILSSTIVHVDISKLL